MRQHIKAASQDFGEIYLTAAHTGQVKGNHYHRRTREWFCLVQGRARLVTQEMETGKIREFAMSADEPVTIEVPPHVAHAIQCVGDEMAIVLAYADQPYDADNPDEAAWSLLEPDSPTDAPAAPGESVREPTTAMTSDERPA